MANFLNTDGLSALWAKIKSKFYTKTEVDAAIPDASSSSPLMDGTATIGTSTNYARADHVHPSDTSKANASDVLIKTNTTSYTPSADYHPATKKYVDEHGGNTYTISMNNNVITLTGSDSSTSSATLPVFGGTSADVWEGGVY